ncbi:hypothetical protein [Stutzerimonas stutzeri]|uniref:hypothetical protein n=1 Tax=Stutzerimonas stutzeri TaxID=316 RepID=UPI0002DDCDA9|nr:hypothetical protein [Stutzerimonas stutzeri]
MMPQTGAGAVRSENQCEQTEDDDQANEKDDADGAAKKLQHAVAPVFREFICSDWPVPPSFKVSLFRVLRHGMLRSTIRERRLPD